MNLFFVTAALILLICSVLTYFYSFRLSGLPGPRLKVFLLYAVITAASAVAVRLFQAENPDHLAGGAMLKFCASLPSVLYALRGYQLRKTKFGFFVLLAIILGMVADVSINLSFLAGGAFFLVGHLLYDFAFLSVSKPSKKQIVLWLILTALMIIPLYIFRAKIGSPAYAAVGLVYISILISTVVFSWSLDKMIFAAAAIFAVSDCFMVINILTDGSTLMKILALLVYYGSLLLYGAVLWKQNIYR
jgi:hypothetical protein